MSCSKCGCRMVTKVGVSQTLLVCTDCGHPRNEIHSQPQARQKAWAYLLMFCLVLAGGFYTVVRGSGNSEPSAIMGSAREK
ncbi:hypothetical protein KBY58_05140 [Cyanobium sp. HWJ4-Hawea]|uniref:hypothetical protein n=1 Tax=Cyanobium sp. HWJ4-Hawea TaxID=2823713 RepID=UPI0020CCBF09|nr:hypothetical protein [Cyanobium sp. HWJ4-Hawea]MCP9808813.1 hypothetical protein [Cyanobium sp. HWJ4-Hawea]